MGRYENSTWTGENSSTTAIGQMDVIMNDAITKLTIFLQSNSSRVRKLLAERSCPQTYLLYDRLLSFVRDDSTHNDLRDVQAIRAFLWERLHMVHWKDVHEVERELFAIATFLLVCVLSRNEFTDPKELARLLDSGLLLGCSSMNPLLSNLLVSITDQSNSISCPTAARARLPSQMNSSVHFFRIRQAKHRMQQLATMNTFSVAKAIPCVSQLGIFAFFERYFKTAEPVVITNAMDDWPASKKWGSIEYILGILGHRTVPIETGSTYLSAESGSEFISGEKFVLEYILGADADDASSGLNGERCVKQRTGLVGDSYVSPPVANNIAHCAANSECAVDGLPVHHDSEHSQTAVSASPPMGYLAQHQLLEQVPSLKRDIITPDYCALLLDIDEASLRTGQEQQPISTYTHHGHNAQQLSASEGSTTIPPNDPGEVLVNAWLGPVGTVSPLHHDPYYNILAQVTGYKYVRLYHTSESPKLCPMPGRMSNNSQIDLLRPLEDLQRDYPLLASAKYSEHVLAPGEMLFIPRWHWHFIMALDAGTALQWRLEHCGAAQTSATTTLTSNTAAVPSQEGSCEEAKNSGDGSTNAMNVPQNKVLRRPLNLPAPSKCLSPTLFSDKSTDDNKIETTPAASEATVGAKKRAASLSFDDPRDKQVTSDSSSEEKVDYSFSVSFWWGARLLQEYR